MVVKEWCVLSACADWLTTVPHSNFGNVLILTTSLQKPVFSRINFNLKGDFLEMSAALKFTCTGMANWLRERMYSINTATMNLYGTSCTQTNHVPASVIFFFNFPDKCCTLENSLNKTINEMALASNYDIKKESFGHVLFCPGVH